MRRTELVGAIRRADTPAAEAFLIRRSRHWLIHVIVLALFAAQFGMAVHASTHLNADQEASLAQICDYCLSANALHNMVDDAAAGPVIVNVAQQCTQKPVIKKQRPKRSFTGFQSRAPPALL
jgi:hypothetical protein